MNRARTIVLIGAAAAVASCGYFNSFYNARRQFADAERAAERGDASTAEANYTGAIEKAAKSYRKYPNSRWSDDALHLIARARFELEEYEAARAASGELLRHSANPEIRGDAHAIHGASAYETGEITVALMHLDSAVQSASKVMRGRAHLWRARVHRDLGDYRAAAADLSVVTQDDPSFTAAQLERIGLGIEQRDSAQAATGFSSVLLHRDSRRWVDTVSSLALDAVGVFGAVVTRQMLNAALPDWLSVARDSIALVRAELALKSGDTTTATTELTQLASRAAAPIANGARVNLARSRLQHAAELAHLREARATLLPAIAHSEAQVLLRNISLIEALAQKAQTAGQPLALFAAAEIARDELRAPQLARRLFVTFVEVAPQTPWAAKALLAALALAPDAEDSPALRTRLAQYTTSPYVQAINTGGDPEAYSVAEDRLQRSLLALMEEGATLAAQMDANVTRVVATLDSLRLVARMDSTRISCGVLIDTLSVVGMRADSVRAACLRADTTSIAMYLKVDTMSWRRMPGDSVGNRRRIPPKTPAVKRDTIKT